MEEHDLSAYLAPAGKAPGIGAERTYHLGDGVTLYASPHGSHELIYVLQRKMQGMMCSRMGDAECNDILRTQLEREMAKYPYNLLTEKNRRRLYKDISLSLTEEDES